ncbi:MAG: MoxR family ATPase [Alphaproteobacteria bacterium]|nr:MoxR family ATPase [Alphaproteobacteria bacterium]MBU0858926.1 MoxR family ATPase [Alphaproteobacteria bacterium]
MTDKTHEQLKTECAEAAQLLESARKEIHKKIFGQEEVITNVLTCMVAGGHALLMGAPGLAKTLLVETIGTVMGMSTNRVQFTPDLMPSDITGSEVMEQDETGKRYFRFIEGPAFTQLLLADEINRASPRTQSATLQAMQEYKVTSGGVTRDLPQPFHILATQNPLEQEGTYPLPEAQRDRFLMQIDVDYPDRASERMIAVSAKSYKPRSGEFNKAAGSLSTVMNSEQLLKIQQLVDNMPVSDEVVDFVVDTVRGCRPSDPTVNPAAKEYVTWPPGPRAEQALIVTAKARALMRGDYTPSKADVLAVMEPVMKARMSLDEFKPKKALMDVILPKP